MRRGRERKTRQESALCVIERRTIVEALERAKAKKDPAAIEAALHLLKGIDESPYEYIAVPN